MNDLERKVDSTTDVQEACTLGWVDGYGKGVSDAVIKRCKAVRICSGCNAELKDDSFYLTSVRLKHKLPPVEMTVGYCPECYDRLVRVVKLLMEV